LILPTKRLPEDRALLAIGADVLSILSRPQTVSKVWEEMKRGRMARNTSTPLPFDWFVLSLSFLFSIGAVDLRDGRLHRVVK
jgi:hypothetical protein